MFMRFTIAPNNHQPEQRMARIIINLRKIEAISEFMDYSVDRNGIVTPDRVFINYYNGNSYVVVSNFDELADILERVTNNLE